MQGKFVKAAPVDDKPLRRDKYLLLSLSLLSLVVVVPFGVVALIIPATSLGVVIGGPLGFTRYRCLSLWDSCCWMWMSPSWHDPTASALACLMRPCWHQCVYLCVFNSLHWCCLQPIDMQFCGVWTILAIIWRTWRKSNITTKHSQLSNRT